MVLEVCRYLSDMEEAVEFIKHSKELRSTLKACLNTLIDFVTGPCPENKYLMGSYILLYNYLNRLLMFFNNFIGQSPQSFNPENPKEKDENLTSCIKIYYKVIELLITLLEGEKPCEDPGNPPPNYISKDMCSIINLEELVRIAY